MEREKNNVSKQMLSYSQVDAWMLFEPSICVVFCLVGENSGT